MAAVLIFFGLALSAAAVAGFLAWRFARAKWRAFHSHGVVVGAMALWDMTASRRRRGGWAAAPEEMRDWSPRRVRKDMWRSVDQAESAVRTATDLGAPVAELPSLCRRLQAAATDLDKVLRVDPSVPAPAGVSDQAAEVMRAAADVQRAAVAAASDANGQRVRDLTLDASQEIGLLDAGLASARKALPHPHR